MHSVHVSEATPGTYTDINWLLSGCEENGWLLLEKIISHLPSRSAFKSDRNKVQHKQSLQKARGMAGFGQQQQQNDNFLLPIYLTKNYFSAYFISGMFQSPPT